MKILISIILNGLILYAMTYFLAENADKWIEAWIILGCGDCDYNSLSAMKSYFIGWVILGLINVIVRPILKILSLPLFFLFLGLVSFVINGIVLYLFTYIINTILQFWIPSTESYFLKSKYVCFPTNSWNYCCYTPYFCSTHTV